GVPTFHDCDDGVRRAEVDTDHLRHVSLPLMTVASGTSRAVPLSCASAYRTSILISFGLTSSAFGSLISRTPSRYAAFTLSAWTGTGRATERSNFPYTRSRR